MIFLITIILNNEYFAQLLLLQCKIKQFELLLASRQDDFHNCHHNENLIRINDFENSEKSQTNKIQMHEY